MAWRCSGSSNTELITNMRDAGLIESDMVAEAFKKVDRANYVLDKRNAYVDSPQPILANATISAPHMHASAATHLLPFLKPGARVLDVGSGSGYTVAIFHQLVGGAGKVIGIDHMDELVSWSVSNLERDGLEPTLSSGSISVVCGDGRKGFPEEAPYDAIHVGAAAPSMPSELVEQLKAPGRMFIPVGTHSQTIIQVDKDKEGKVMKKKLLDVLYVPLTDKEIQAKGY